MCYYLDNVGFSKGSFISLEEEHYFINYKDNNSLYITNDNNLKTKIYNEQIKNLTAYKGWIYFTDHIGSTIFRIKPDGKNKEIVYKSEVYVEEEISSIKYYYDDSIMNISNIIIKGEWIYFNEYVGESLKRVRTDGKDVVILQRGLSSNINVAGEYIYFLNEFDGKIHRIVDCINKESSNEIENLAWEVPDITQLYIINKYAYFIQLEEKKNTMFNLKVGKIYKMNLESNDLKKLCDDVVAAIDFGEKYIFYINALDSYSLYRMDIDGSGAVRLSKAKNIIKIKVIGLNVFFITNNNSLYKINIRDVNECKMV